jgi:hypothetical protein
MPRADAAGLFTARAVAWALLLTAWLALGSLGAEHAVGLPGGAALPLVVWLLTVGALLAGRVGERFSPRARTVSMTAAAATGLGAIAAPGAGVSVVTALVVLALAWAALTVEASRVVRGWRQRVRLRVATSDDLPSPAPAALTGGVMAWAAAGDLLMVRHAAASLSLVLVAAVAVAALTAFAAHGGLRWRRPRGDASAGPPAPWPAAGGCRSGLFDCSLPLPAPSEWRRVERWPLHAAAWAMLPMMVALPAMAAWCSEAGWSPRTTAALHLGVMLAPGALARPLLARCSATSLAAIVTALLVGGLVALGLMPGLTGVMTLSFAHAIAWSLAWGWQLAVREARPAATAPHGVGAAAIAAAAVAGLFAALSASGPPALAWAHALLAGVALAAWAARASPWAVARSG